MTAPPLPPEDAGTTPAEQPAPGEGETVAKRAGIVAVFTLASRVLGYVRDATLANVFGASAAYDAFVVAHTIPNFLRRLVAEGSLVITFVPLLAEERRRGGRPAMRSFFSAVLGVLIPLLLVLTAAGVLFPEPLVTAFAPGFEPERAEIAVRLTRIMMGYIFFISLMALAGGALNVEGVFAAPAAAPILLNLAIVGFALGLGSYFDAPIDAVGYGVLLGGALQLLLQLPALARRGLLVVPRLELSHPSLIELLRRMLPAVFGVAVYQINIMVIRQIGSYLPSGQLSCYYNATRLQEFALGVFAVSVSVAALPTLSEHAASGDFGRMRATFRRALLVTNFVTIPSTLALLVLSAPIVGVLFRHGAYGSDAAAMTAELLSILALAMVPVGAARVIVPAFYALGDTKTPVYAALASLVATFGIGHAVKEVYEIHGLVAATSIAAVIQAALLFGLFRRALARRSPGAVLPEVGGPSLPSHAIRTALAALPGAAVAYWLAQRLDWFVIGKLEGSGFLFGLLVLIGGTFALLSRPLGLEEIGLVTRALGRRFTRLVKKV